MDVESVVIDLATRLGVPGLMIWAAVKLGTPLVKVWATRETERTEALRIAVDLSNRILGEVRVIRRQLSPGDEESDDAR